MTLAAFVGDCTTTIALGVAAADPAGHDPLVVEADRSGGSIAAWFDTPLAPSLSTIVAGLRETDGDGPSAWRQIERGCRRSRSGLRFIPAPVRSTEARRTIQEAERAVFPAVARHTTALADVGRRAAADGIPGVLRIADTVVVCHRQATASAQAAGVRVERVAELVEVLASEWEQIVVAIIGDAPFDEREIGDFLATAAPTTSIRTHVLAVDDLAAAVLAGRRGLSARRFARLPFVRTCRGLAELMLGTDLEQELRR